MSQQLQSQINSLSEEYYNQLEQLTHEHAYNDKIYKSIQQTHSILLNQIWLSYHEALKGLRVYQPPLYSIGPSGVNGEYQHEA